MPNPITPRHAQSVRLRVATTLIVASVVGASAALAGLAIARTFTLDVAKGATVTSLNGMTSRQAIVVNSRGHAVYTLSGDSPSHPKCTRANGCFGFWPPVKVASRTRVTRGAGVKGKLGAWHRDGFWQVTLNGHPLYMFSGDMSRDHATGEGIVRFGGTWHVVRPAAVSSPTGTSSTPTTPPPMGTTTTPTYSPY